jgi:hypothetical protein
VREYGVLVLWCRGEQMIADGMTKALGGPQMDAWRKQLFGGSLPTTIRASEAEVASRR